MLSDELLIIEAIGLLYKQSQVSDGDRSIDLVDNIIKTVKPVGGSVMIDPESVSINQLRELLTSMRDEPTEVIHLKSDILQRVKVISNGNERLIDAISYVVDINLSNEELRISINNSIRIILNYFKELEVKKIISKTYRTLMNNRDSVGNMANFVKETIAELEPYMVDRVDSDASVTYSIDSSNLEDMMELFDRAVEEINGDALIRSGWQRINDMLGGGFRRGRMYTVVGLQHMNKSGFLIKLFIHAALYNKPHLFNPDKKPLLLFISLENEWEQNIILMYKFIREARDPSVMITPEYIKSLSSEEKARYICDNLQATGFTCKFLRVNPSEWSYRDLQDNIIRQEQENYEVVLLAIDYLSLIPTIGCAQGPAGVDYRDLFRRIRNFTSIRKTTVLTPHQMSSDAITLNRTEVENLVKRVADGGGYYSNSRQIPQEVDGELFIHIIKKNGKSYQEVHRGKLRDATIVPQNKLYACYEFKSIGTLPDDINGADMCLDFPGAEDKDSVFNNNFKSF